MNDDDYDFISRVCRRVGFFRLEEDPDMRFDSAGPGQYYVEDPALHALLVQRLQVKTGACIDYFPEDGTWLVIERGNYTEDLETPIDIIRVLVDALEDGE